MSRNPTLKCSKLCKKNPVICRVAHVTPIPKGPPSTSVANYRPISLTPILSKVLSIWCQFILGNLWNAELCFHPPSLLIGKVLALVMPFCVWHTPYRVHWRLCGRLKLFRLTSVLLLQGQPSGDTIQALLCGYWRFCAELSPLWKTE